MADQTPAQYEQVPYVAADQQPFMLAQMSPQPARRPRRTILLVSLIMVVVLAGAGLSTYALLSRDKTFTVTGTLTLGRGNFVWGVSGETDLRCGGRRGYDDVRGGTQVTVSAPDGAIIGVGRLDEGVARVEPDRTASECTFSFSVVDVPKGHGFYGVEVGRRGVLRYREAVITGGPLRFSLG